MSHSCIVIDKDKHFVINPITRKIENETNEKLSLMQYDHNSERYTFEVPEEIEGHKVMDCNVIQVHYINIDAQTKIKHEDIFEIQDKEFSEDGTKVIFSWLLSQNATQYAGILAFLVRFSCVNESGKVTYAWHTEVNQTISIKSGMFNSESIVTEYADIIEPILEDIKYLKKAFENLPTDDGADELPEVTVEDNGKHLEVVDGEWVAKEVETTGGSERITLVEEQILPFTAQDGFVGLEITDPSMVVPIVEGETYIVALDGTEYECVGVLLSTEIDGEPLNYYYIGNASIVNMGENTGEPFVFVYILESNGNLAIVSGEETTHTVGIYQGELANELPEVTTEDNGKFLQVVDGKWTAVAITDGNEVAY